MAGEAPSNRSIEELFARARSARIVRIVPGARGIVLAEVPAESLSVVRDALRIREGGEDFHCMCAGTLAVEARGRFLSAGRVTYHHGRSVRLSGWRSDAWLEDGPALVRWLAERGVEEPLREIDREEQARHEADAARDAWTAAAPPSLSLEALEVGPAGLPKRLDAGEVARALGSLRAAHGDDRAVARVLLSWLAAGRGPWNGYPAYEDVPPALLRALPPSSVVDVALDPSLGEREIASAARHFAHHEMVTFAKRALAVVPEELFERARPVVSASGTADDLARLEHAARVAASARARATPRAPYGIEGGCSVIGESLDGPLSGLAAAGDALFACDVRTLVRFEAGSTAPIAIAEASEHFVALAAHERLCFATMNAGDVFVVDADGPSRVAAGRRAPIEIATRAEHVAWLERDAPGGRTIGVARGGVLERTIGPLASDAWSLVVADRHVLWIEDAWTGAGAIGRASLDDGRIERLARVPKLGPSMGSPRLCARGDEVLAALPDAVLAIDGRGRTERVATAPAPIRAIAADARRIVLLVGGDTDDRWSFAVVPEGGGDARVTASFDRAPYHRHPLALAAGRACTLGGDRVLAVPLS